MGRKILTVKDIEKLYDSGEKELKLSRDVAITDLAFERARELGLAVIGEHADLAPSAPVRPYLSRGTKPAKAPDLFGAKSAASMTASVPQVMANQEETSSELRARIVNAVLEKFSGTLDRELIERIIDRVMAASGVK